MLRMKSKFICTGEGLRGQRWVKHKRSVLNMGAYLEEKSGRDLNHRGLDS